MMRNDMYGSMPGISTAQETYENHFRFGRDTGAIVGAVISSTALDAGNTPTTVLRAGLILGQITSTGELAQHSVTATDGTDQVYGVLMDTFNILDGTNAARDLFAWVLVSGSLKAANLINLTEMARAQMAGRFIFDDRNFVPNSSGMNRIIAKPSGYTVTAADSNTLFTTTGAVGAVTFLLPTTVTKGSRFRFYNTVGQNMVITAAANKMIGFNNATATTLTFSTAGNLIGASVEFVADDTGTKWMSNLLCTNTAVYS